MRSLPITPVEAYVLSRVDGYTSAAEIAMITGLGDEVDEILKRLESLGALMGSGKAPPPAASVTRPPPPPAASQASGVASTTRLPAAPRTSAVDIEFGPEQPTRPVVARAPTPSFALGESGSSPGLPATIERLALSELDEDVEIEPERRRRILELFYSLDTMSHYDLLDVPQNADKKDIKKAYWVVAQEFHPDRYFRKRVGSYKAKLEALFKRVTEAHDTLTRNGPRADYDAELKRSPKPGLRPLPQSVEAASAAISVRPPRHIPSAPPPAHHRSHEGRPAGATTQSMLPTAPDVLLPPRAPSFPTQTASPSIPPPTPPSPAPPPPAAPPPAVPRDEPSLPVDERARQRALATKLSGAFGAVRPSQAPPPPSQRSEDGARAARDSLRRMAAAKTAESSRGEAVRHRQQGDEAAARNDAESAANHYRLALALSPNDPELQRLSDEWVAKAQAATAPQFIKLGDNAANKGAFEDAARLYGRALMGRPDDPTLLIKAATALLQGPGDLHRAASYARKAVELSPNNLECRLCLIRVYQAANLTLNARRELSSAAQMAPDDPRIKALLKDLG